MDLIKLKRNLLSNFKKTFIFQYTGLKASKAYDVRDLFDDDFLYKTHGLIRIAG